MRSTERVSTAPQARPIAARTSCRRRKTTAVDFARRITANGEQLRDDLLDCLIGVDDPGAEAPITGLGLLVPAGCCFELTRMLPELMPVRRHGAGRIEEALARAPVHPVVVVVPVGIDGKATPFPNRLAEGRLARTRHAGDPDEHDRHDAGRRLGGAAP